MTYSYGKTPASVIRKAFTTPFSLSLVGNERLLVIKLVNQGIDSHLEAFTESTFTHNPFLGPRLECSIYPKDMPVLLRRLLEDGSDEAIHLRTDILSCQEIEEV